MADIIDFNFETISQQAENIHKSDDVIEKETTENVFNINESNIQFEDEVETPAIITKNGIFQPDEDKYAVEPEDVFKASSQYIDDFDAVCQTEGIGYEAPHFPLWSEKMEGLMNGFYIFAGYANSGKSAICMNIAMDYAMCEDNHLFLIYYSLDDTKEDIVARILAMRKHIPISVVRKPKRYQQFIDEGRDGSSKFKKMLKLREEGLEELKGMSKHFMVKDGDTIDCIERMLNHAKMVKRYLRAKDPQANVLIVIDSLMDVNIDSKNFREEKDRNTAISQLVKRYATTEIKCPIFGTAHVRKNSGKRISISDLKESGRYEYDARAVFLITNDVSRNGQNAEIYYVPNGTSNKKEPVIEIYWAKNKASSFKERTYCFFVPEYSLATECNKSVTEQYDAIVYGD